MDHLSEREASIAIMRGVLRLGRRLRAERPPERIALAQLGALDSLSRLGPMPAARLAEAMRLQPQSLTRLVAALEEAGFILRTPGSIDRRMLILDITPQGRAALKRDLAARRRWLEGALSAHLTQAERHLLAAASSVMLKLADL